MEGPRAAGPGRTVTFEHEGRRITLWLGYPEHRSVAAVDAERRRAMRPPIPPVDIDRRRSFAEGW